MTLDRNLRPLDSRGYARRVVGTLALLAGSVFTAACDVHGASDPGSLSTLVVSPSTQTLPINGTQQFIAVGKDFAGVELSTSPTWTVASGGGTISADGLFTAGTVPGTYANTVVATSGSLSSRATVIVTVGTLASVTVTPNPDTLAVNGVRQYAAVGRDIAGNVIPITPTWSVTNGGGSIGSSTGLFTAGTVAGSFVNTIRATSGVISGSATTVVTPGTLATLSITPSPASLGVLATQQFTATGRDAAGNTLAVTPVWSVTNGGGSIGAATGVFTAGTLPGTYSNTVRATVGAVSATATVTVTTGALATIVVAPNPVSLNTGATQQFVATGRDIAGNNVGIVPAWSVANGGGSIGTTSGLFTAGTTAGTFANTVVATVGTISGSASVDVSAVVASITVTPNPATLAAGASQPFVAIVRDAFGNTMTATPVWSVVNGGGSVVPATGVFTAGTTPGSFANTLRASIGSISGSATITVTAGALASIIVTPNPVALMPGVVQQFVASGRDASNNPVTITPTWSVVNGGGAINETSGVFTAGMTAGIYAGTVRATSGTVSGSATVTIATGVVPPIVNLGAAAPNGIMAGTAVTCVNGGIINADVSVSPGNTVNGFGPCVITGVQNLANAAAEQAQLDLTAAYNTLAGLACPPANAIVANLGGTTKEAGVYCTESGIGVTGTLTLDGGGDPNATFVFQAGTGLTTAGNVVLINGAQAKNVYWLVGTSATIGTASQWKGNIIALTSITLVDNATLIGRALARNGAVSLGTNNVITLP